MVTNKAALAHLYISQLYIALVKRPFFEGRWTFLLTKVPHDFSIKYTLKLKKNWGSPISGFVFGHLKSKLSFTFTSSFEICIRSWCWLNIIELDMFL